MKRFLASFAILAIVILGCNISTPITQSVTPQPGVTDTIGGQNPTKAATEPVSVTVTGTPTPAPNVSCNELSFYLDPDLASGNQCETVPQAISPTGFGTNPQYTKVSLVGYVLADRLMKPVISVFPIEQFSQLLPDPVNGDVKAMQNLIAGAVPSSGELPLLPPQYANQLFFAQYIVVPFHNGKGYYCVTMFAQADYPANNHDIFFSYQGMTMDGKYWISIILPISHPNLPQNGDNPPQLFYSNKHDYYSQITSQLNDEETKSFVPSILKLNTLIKSIMIQP